jgi:hypothetical protein
MLMAYDSLTVRPVPIPPCGDRHRISKHRRQSKQTSARCIGDVARGFRQKLAWRDLHPLLSNAHDDFEIKGIVMLTRPVRALLSAVHDETVLALNGLQCLRPLLEHVVEYSLREAGLGLGTWGLGGCVMHEERQVYTSH